MQSFVLVPVRDGECLNKSNIREDSKVETNTRDVKKVGDMACGSWLVEEREGTERCSMFPVYGGLVP